MANSSLAPDSFGRGVYYGWWQVYALSVTETVSWGVLYYSFAVMLAPMQTELGWTRAQTTGAFSLAQLVAGLAAFPVGRMIDRRGARLPMTLGSIAAALLVFAWAAVESLTTFYLLWAGIGVAMAATLYEPAFAVIAKWFTRKRGHALTVLTLCAGLASVIFVPLAERLVSAYGWRSALVILSVMVAVLTIPLHAFVLRRAPADMGLLPDGDPVPAHDEPPAVLARSMPIGAALRSRAFWWLTASFWLKTVATATIIVHLIPYLTERGYRASFAATAIAVIGGSQLPGRIAFAAVGSRLPQRLLTAALFLMQAVALVVLVFAGSVAGVLLFAVLFGVSNGALTPARAGLVAEVYGAAEYASIAGVIAAFVTIASAAAPVGASLLYERTGGYDAVLWCLIVASIGATIAVLAAREETRG